MENKTEAVRLNKYLSQAGVCSRREADRLIESGEVLVDGKIADMGMKVMPDQTVVCQGKVVGGQTEMILLAVNKPVGIVCTTAESEPDNIVTWLNYPSRVFPAGRLDKASQGLVLMTNQGELMDQILRARNYHEKEYLVTIDQPVNLEFLRKMRSGVHIRAVREGEVVLDEVTRPCTVEKVSRCTFRIILTQGLNRQIRRMCEALGCRVRKLERVRVMNIELGDLAEGQYRRVEGRELEELLRQLKKSER